MSTRLEELKRELQYKNEELETAEFELDELNSELENYELDEDEYKEAFNQFLDELHGDFFGHPASTTLEAVDPIAYEQELSNWLDSQDVSEDAGYKELEEEIQDLEEQIEYLGNKIQELEEEIQDLEEEEE